ncbi:vacuolar protein, partial [Tanacetum coccineum]
ENAANVIGLLGCDLESVEHMIDVGVCSVFDMLLKEGPIKVQKVVAWADSELVKHYPKCQNLYAQHSIVRFLVGHLAFDTSCFCSSPHTDSSNLFRKLKVTYILSKLF